ncbi:Lipopolysaccharide-assembly [Chitinophaga costaii]|uniref:Lipopolysaccharide-assembly n=1 Tax=Chitinophaga costaii TaxID=1335309 RepID=A0A1C4EQV0_9BACT|nr:LPS assembly lipoprotein LptE [Chitinophaga costaii]SCC45960.1 Lipopolysaccharide-assembly [Chitinophaga costaii]
MKRLIGLVAVVMLFGGCSVKYSISGASIDAEAKTVNVTFIENRAPLNNPLLSQKVTEALKTKITSQTKLTQVNEPNADYEFKGYISGYTFTNAAVTQVEQAATSRLTVTISITFVKRVGDKKGYQQSFSRSADFPASKLPSEVENGLLDETIVPQMVDDIFNRAFANW